jgi:hypothetical protein
LSGWYYHEEDDMFYFTIYNSKCTHIKVYFLKISSYFKPHSRKVLTKKSVEAIAESRPIEKKKYKGSQR